MAESDITAMRETLLAQQQLLQKLYAELDEEREASATAASEAMDMIVRLQGEKAAVKMEASHFKRMAEEKIGHAEATLELYEEVMYQKEMEITSLEYQVMAYKNKLLALGSDFNASDFEFDEDLLLHKIDQQHNGENSQASSTIRRLSSLPPIPLPPIPLKNNLRSVRKRDRSPSPAPVLDMLPTMLESDTDPEVTSPRKSVDYGDGSLDAYWNQIQRLDEKVKVMSDCKETGRENKSTLRSRRGKSCSAFLHASTKINTDLIERIVAPPTTTTSSDKVNHNEGTSDREAVVIPSCSGNVYDVFEVPQSSEKHKAGGNGKRRLERWSSFADNRLTKPDPVSVEVIGSHSKYDMDKLKSMLSGNHESKIHSPKENKAIVWPRKEGMGVDWNAEAEFQKLHQRIDQLERETIGARKEIMHKVNGEEHLRLLKDICSQLKLLDSEIKSLKTPKAAPNSKRDNPFDPLQEAMVYFWI